MTMVNTCIFKFLILVFRDKLRMEKKHTQTYKIRLSDVETRIAKHYSCARSIFPDISEEEVVAPGIALASSFTQLHLEDPGFIAYLDYELELRIGHGHDLLEVIRLAAGLHNFYVIKQRHSRGQLEMQKVAKSQSAAATKKSRAVQAYTKNWFKITQILNCRSLPSVKRVDRLKGLQELRGDQDVKFFESNGVLTNSFVSDAKLNISWIWQIAMLEAPDMMGQSSARERVHIWEKEGAFSFFETYYFLIIQIKLGESNGFNFLVETSGGRRKCFCSLKNFVG